ncbi:glucuronyl esterase domain-containing protein [Flavitalea flava]
MSILLIAGILKGAPGVFGQVVLPRLVGDSMILQRDVPVNIWGKATPGEKVSVRFNGAVYEEVTGASGNWSVRMSPTAAGGPFIMEIDGKNHIVLKDILIGDVWVCSGQSNMELSMERVKEKYAEVIAHCGNPAIRQFSQPMRYYFSGPADEIPSGKWETASSSSVLNFSAVGYFFAKALNDQEKIPIGLIKTSVGGSPAEAWLSEKALKAFPQYQMVADRFKDNAFTDSIRKKENFVSKDWYQRLWQQDSGLNNSENKSWLDPGYDDSSWEQMRIPGFFEPVPYTWLQNGVVWLRKEIDIPERMTGHSVKLFLGRIVDQDSVYVNGVFAGTTGYQYPPRRYELPAGVLRPGKNSIVIRVINSSGQGGFVPDKPYCLIDKDLRIDLSGNWKFRWGAHVPALPGNTFFQYQPGGLYNGIIAPLLPLAIKGVIWYQGEANTAKAKEYNRLFTALIEDWRREWGQGVFPFLFVQLPNFTEVKPKPAESNWAELREAQLRTLSLPQTGMAVTIDIGEWNDIHPLNKEDVGKRLALVARKVAYTETGLVFSGPLYRSMQKEGHKIRISFTNTGSGLLAKGAANGDSVLHCFAIAGPDKIFFWAKASIEGNEVVVWNDQVPNPVAVRYAWADNPEGANLYNKEGLPASPFRTDTAVVLVALMNGDRISPRLKPPVQLTAEQDHRRLMQILHIDSIRPGPSGNPKAQDAANNDESKASPYSSLPDPLRLKNGKKVTSAKMWWKQRRPEIVEDFDREVYGRVPAYTPKVNWELVNASRDTIGAFPVITKKLLGHVDNTGYPLLTVDIQLTLVTPAMAAGPVPVIMEFGFVFPPGFRPPVIRPQVSRLPVPSSGSAPADPSWQEQVLAKGWGYAILIPTSYQPDNGAGLTEGIIGLAAKGQPRKPDDWGALSAWAWGAGRALDYLETDRSVDAGQVGIEGLSRYGKAAIVTMAYDPRFAIAFVGSSGEGGTKIHRRHFGEQVENVASSFEYHWMAGNFIKYAGPLTANDLPVDAHELIALCAPRPVFISSGSPKVEGTWVDAKGILPSDNIAAATRPGQTGRPFCSLPIGISKSTTSNPHYINYLS